MIVAIKGGLGNQLFQAAFAIALRRRWNCEVKVDDRDFPNRGREFMLDRVGINLPKANEKEIFASRWGCRFANAKIRYWAWKLCGVGEKEQGIFKEPKRWTYTPEALERPEQTYFNGYWMSFRYWAKDFSGEDDFPFLASEWPEPLKSTAERIRQTRSVGVHIRRGDYANVEGVRQTYLVCSPDYFRKAMEGMVSEFSDLHFFLFSDDAEYVGSLDWGPMNVTIVPSIRGVGDEHYLRLLSSCDHQIISNSTFSWWAAYLNRNPDKQVCCPDRWQSSVSSESLVGEFIPPEWKLLKT